jgi:hypothetical protein
MQVREYQEAAAGVAATVRAAYPSCHPDDKIA